MEIQLVNALIGIRGKPEESHFSTQVYKTGPSKIAVTEIPIIQAMNGLDCVSKVSPAGWMKTSKGEEMKRLEGLYQIEALRAVYPSTAAPIPHNIEGLGLDPDQIETMDDPDDVIADEEAVA